MSYKFKFLRLFGLAISAACTLVLMPGCAGVKHSSIHQHPELVAVDSSSPIPENGQQSVTEPAAETFSGPTLPVVENQPKPELPESTAESQSNRPPPQWWTRPKLSSDKGSIDKINRHLGKENQERDQRDRGIRYYATAPYVFIYSDLKGGIVWELHHLPDTTRILSAKPYTFLAKNEFTMTFNTNGVLSQVIEKPDTTVIPTAIAAAVKEMAPLLVKALGIFDAPTVSTVPAVLVYRLRRDDNGNAFLVGGFTDVEKFHLRPEANDKSRDAEGNQAEPQPATNGEGPSALPVDPKSK